MTVSAAAMGRRGRMRRLLLLLIVVLLVAPATWLQSSAPYESTDDRQLLKIVPLLVPQVDLGEVRVAGAWQLESPNRHFGSYSALVPFGDGTLLAVADTGRQLRFTPPGRDGPGPMLEIFVKLEPGEKRLADVEAISRDAGTGQVWAAYEQSNVIERYDARLRSEGRVQPTAMRRWRSNSGPEAMTRLADGRFLVIAEAGPGWFDAQVPALLFAGDPVAGAAPRQFAFRPPAGYRPVDVAPLPDGRVLILLREVLWGIPPKFAGKLMVADPAAIRPGKPWSGEVIADLMDPLPTDNYEGLAIEPAGDGGLVLWLISDDNDVRIQRTLLLKLLWRPNEKARGRPRAPR